MMDLSPMQRSTLWTHHQRVIETNQRFNLTRITEPAEFAVKHHADSLAVVAWTRDSAVDVGRILDIGSGAGLPAVPLAVANPNWHVVAIDGTGKKAAFVNGVADELGLANLHSFHARAESWRSDRRFDLVVLKAIGPIARCLDLAYRHLRPDGQVAIYKTANMRQAEISDGLATAGRLGFVDPVVYPYELPLGDETLARTLWIYRLARGQSPGLPRRRRRHSRSN